MPEAYIYDVTRPPIGRYAGALRDVRTDGLAGHPIRALAACDARVDGEALGDCIMGCANQANQDNRNVARRAVQQLRTKAGRSTGNVDIIALNGAFASQVIAALRQLGLPDDADHMSPHGGAIPFGHPLGISGARLALTDGNAMETLGQNRAIATMCIGVGQGIATLIERV